MEMKNLVASLFLLLLVLWTSGSFAQRSSFGESCDATKKCDKRAWLTCRNGSCDCMKPDVMMYEDSLEKCASKAGERCKFIIEEFENNNTVFEMISCIENSKCSSEGFCVCDNKFYEDLNGTCSRSSSHMETCDSVVKCSKYEGLLCTDGLCKCNETVSTYSDGESSDRQCVGLAGESCINSKCTSNATCSSGNVCTCDEDYYQDEDKKCVQKVGAHQNCTKNEECTNFKGSQLICLDGVCNCDPTGSQYGSARKYMRSSSYSYNSGYFDGASLTQCLGLTGSPCLDKLCVPSAYCYYPQDSSNNNNSGTCHCVPGYTKSKSGNCAMGFNDYCTSPRGCIDGLICGAQRCRCPYDGQDFDRSALKCVSKVGGPCNSLVSCVTNAECVLFSKEPLEAGHCSCTTGFVKNFEGKCDIAFGRPCLPNSGSTGYVACDSVAGLYCLNYKCQCNQFAKFSEKHRKCLGLVGANCDLASKEPQCVENSQCEKIHPLLQGVCSCPSESGFKETSEYTCEVENEVAKKSPIHDEE